jgi:large subunit ribosomal protein L2
MKIRNLNTLKPIKNRFTALETRIKSFSGRSLGKIVSPRRSSHHRRIYRFLDYKRVIFPGKRGVIVRDNYIPGRSARGSIVCFTGGVFVQILKPEKSKRGDLIHNQCKEPTIPGDSSKLSNFPSGVLIHNISRYAQRIGQMTRSAGCSTILVRKEGDHVLLKLKSGTLQYFHNSATATLGAVAGGEHFLRNYKYAGVMRRLGKRPRTRPSAMNPVDHPMGGRTRGGSQPMNRKGIITVHRSTVKSRHPSVLYTRRQMKFRRF